MIIVMIVVITINLLYQTTQFIMLQKSTHSSRPQLHFSIRSLTLYLWTFLRSEHLDFDYRACNMLCLLNSKQICCIVLLFWDCKLQLQKWQLSSSDMLHRIAKKFVIKRALILLQFSRLLYLHPFAWGCKMHKYRQVRMASVQRKTFCFI